MAEIRTESDSELFERTMTVVDDRPKTAAREAIRLGHIGDAGHRFELDGPEGISRPTAQISGAASDNEAG